MFGPSFPILSPGWTGKAPGLLPSMQTKLILIRFASSPCLFRRNTNGEVVSNMAVLESNHVLICGCHCWLVQQCSSTPTELSRSAIDSGQLTNKWRGIMNINLTPEPLFALIAGILILIFPRILNYVVAIYLIIIGIMGLWGRPV